jgi:hypothetical protein
LQKGSAELLASVWCWARPCARPEREWRWRWDSPLLESAAGVLRKMLYEIAPRASIRWRRWRQE